MHTPNAVTSSTTASSNTSRKLFAAIFTLMLGSVLVLTVGFAPLEAAHNAAHDTRHSSAFPCH